MIGSWRHPPSTAGARGPLSGHRLLGTQQDISGQHDDAGEDEVVVARIVLPAMEEQAHVLIAISKDKHDAAFLCDIVQVSSPVGEQLDTMSSFAVRAFISDGDDHDPADIVTGCGPCFPDHWWSSSTLFKLLRRRV